MDVLRSGKWKYVHALGVNGCVDSVIFQDMETGRVIAIVLDETGPAIRILREPDSGEGVMHEILVMESR